MKIFGQKPSELAMYAIAIIAGIGTVIVGLLQLLDAFNCNPFTK